MAVVTTACLWHEWSAYRVRPWTVAPLWACPSIYRGFFNYYNPKEVYDWITKTCIGFLAEWPFANKQERESNSQPAASSTYICCDTTSITSTYMGCDFSITSTYIGSDVGIIYT